jgi:hypothetical protein
MMLTWVMVGVTTLTLSEVMVLVTAIGAVGAWI